MIYLFFGENTYKRQQLLQSLMSTFRAQHGEHAVERFDGDSLELARLAEALQGTTLFSPEKLVIIKDASRNKALWVELEKWVEAIPEGVELALSETSPDKRTKTFKLLQKRATVVRECKPLADPEATVWLVAEAKQRGGELSSTQAQRIVTRAGTDQWRLSHELDKLLVQLTIDDAAIDELVEQTPQANMFALLDAALQKKPAQVRQLLNDAKAIEDPYMLFGLLSSNVLQLAALVYAEGRSAEIIAKDLSTHPFPLKKLQPLARSMENAELQYIVEVVASADNLLKTSATEPWLVLEHALLQIAAR